MSSELPRPLRGIIPPLVTPLNPDGSLDLPGLDRLIDMLLQAGVHGLFPLGTTGEAPHLGRGLRAEFLGHVARITRGRVPVLAGITDSSVDEAAWMAARAADAGCDAVVFAAPHYYPMTQGELTGYAFSLAKRLPLPFVIYNIPFCTRDYFEFDAVRRIADLPGCLGVKDSTGDMDFYQSLVGAFRDRADLTVLMGPEERLWDAVMMGGHGAVTGGANLAPELFTGIYAAAVANKPEDAAPLIARSQIISNRIYSVLPERSGYFRGLKCAMEMRGICAGGLAAPFEPIAGEPRERIRRALIDAGLL
ncbi:MAG: dihydrodipicolinate synthase family protein [Candidatus Solibacter sp.]|nr:dihydrodipicolinate synthase family protein [Candidatus Solibacter sp.]